MRSDGVVGYYISDVGSSYGRRSPSTSGTIDAWRVFHSGIVYVDYYSSVNYDSYGRRSPDTYMGGSEGVMQVADYGEIQFETWLNSSYGTISPNRNHTNETINAFRISFSGDIDGRNWIFTTGSYGIWKNMLPNSFKKWWLRSPDTNVFDASDCAWNVRHFGDVDYYNGVWDSYGRTSSRRARVILSVRFSSLFPVTPASTMVVLILSTFLRVYPHKFKYHYREINSRLGHLWKERRE